MECNFNKEIYTKGCRLYIKFIDEPVDMYQYIFNPDTKEFSEIYSCESGMEYEFDEDGVYYIVTYKNPNAVLSDGKLTIDSRCYDAETLQSALEAPISIIGDRIFDINETLSICKLRKCLMNLEMKVFQDLLKSCGSTRCAKNDEIRSQRDFIFIAVWLIEHYLELGNLEKARTIYESIRSCGSLCNDLLNNKNECGCNG